MRDKEKSAAREHMFFTVPHYKVRANRTASEPFYDAYLCFSPVQRDMNGMRFGLKEDYLEWSTEMPGFGLLWRKWWGREFEPQQQSLKRYLDRQSRIRMTLQFQAKDNTDVANLIWDDIRNGVDVGRDVYLTYLNATYNNENSARRGEEWGVTDSQAYIIYENKKGTYPLLWDTDVASQNPTVIDRARRDFQWLHYALSLTPWEVYFGNERRGPFRMGNAWGVGQRVDQSHSPAHAAGLLPDVRLPAGVLRALCLDAHNMQPQDRDLAEAELTRNFRLLPAREQQVVVSWHADTACPWKGTWSPEEHLKPLSANSQQNISVASAAHLQRDSAAPSPSGNPAAAISYMPTANDVIARPAGR
ncbi:hypothetical protein ACFV2D_35440 [Streptomyces capillispiralis]|uniref:hypothetical protein n=1 Tax=Streptomyces capillispiralis TaxID=68182 RepID=UPI0036AB8EDA